MKSVVALGTSIRLKLMKRVLPFPRMAKCLHCTRERVERVWGRRAGRITFKRQKKERNSFISLVEPGMLLGPCLGPFSFLTRTAALRNSPHAEYQDDGPASIFEELQFSLLAKLFFFFVSLILRSRLGSREDWEG